MLDTPVGKEIYRQGALSGRKEGLRKGAYHGAQHILLKQASEKFGHLPSDLQKRIAATTSPQELDRLAVALLKIQSVAEFKALINYA